MTGSSRGTAKRGEFGAAVIALFATAAMWQGLSRAATYLLVENDLASIALDLRPWDGLALRNLVFVATDRPKPLGRSIVVGGTKTVNVVERLAKRALVTKPLDPTTLRLLAQSAESRRDRASAEKIMEVAGQQTIRDAVVNAYLLQLQAGRMDYARALERADALLRVTPALTSSILFAVDTIAVDPAGQKALIPLLQSGPPWRGAFLADIASKLVSPEDFLDVVLALKVGPHPLTNEELRAYLDPLIARDLVDRAYETWLHFLPSQRLAALRYVDNGDFGHPPTNLPFDWMITPVAGANVAVDEGPDQNGRALHVLFDGRRVPFRHVTQMLKLPAGRYRLSGSYWSMALDNPRGMTWRIYCAQRSNAMPVAETDRVSGTSNGWKTFGTSFEIPPDRCTAQWLRLELAARVNVEESVAGGIWYDHIDVSRSQDDRIAPDHPGIRMPDQPGTPFERAVRGR